MKIDGDALRGELPGQRQHLALLRNAQSGGRLVEDHQFRFPADCPRDRDRLSLASREFVDLGVQRRNVDVELLEGLARVLMHRAIARHPHEPLERAPAELAADEEIGGRVEVRDQRQILEHGFDAEGSRDSRRGDRRRFPLALDRPRVRGVDPGYALDQGRLSGAVVAEESHDLAATDIEVDVAQRLDAAEPLA